MQPIVDGLESEYSDRIEFRTLDANSDEGGQAFRAYNLRGHPSYILLNLAGEILWTGLGEQTASQIKPQLDAALGQ